MKRITKYSLLLLMITFITACDSDNKKEVVEQVVTTTIVDAAVANGSFTTLVAALQATGLDAVLSDTTATFTVFAPTDEAFALLGQDTIDALLADTDTLSSILTYHVLSTEVDATAAIASAGTTVTTVNGAALALSLDGDSLLVNTVTVTATDIFTDNGVIHVIDAVLIPPAAMGMPTANIVDTAVAAGSFTTLVAALQATGLDAVLADESATFTVFAPTDDAFNLIGDETIALLLDNPDVLSDILLQHVIAGSAVDSVTAFSLNGTSPETASGATIPLLINSATDLLTFGGANVIITDIYTTNGVIHVIDTVIIADVELPAPPMSLVDVAVDNGSFTTLVAALEATGLDAVLANLDEDYTVFAPTDAAFALLPAGTVEALLADPDTLANILLYHVLPGTVLADAAVSVAQAADSKVTTANGDMLALSVVDSMLYVNQSIVTTSNVVADNGVIHVIDRVILPPAMMGEPTDSIVDVALGNPDFSTLVTALLAADLVDTLADETQTFTVFAPTNAAFEKIPADDLNALLADTAALTQVLLTHVVAGAAISSIDAYAANGMMVETASGTQINVMIDGDTRLLNIGGANVIMSDIYTTNGVIHVIDTVIME
jgi:transforming growth factor-beta-induced protein